MERQFLKKLTIQLEVWVTMGQYEFPNFYSLGPHQHPTAKFHQKLSGIIGET